MSIEWSIFGKDAGKGRGGVEINFFTVSKPFFRQSNDRFLEARLSNNKTI